MKRLELIEEMSFPNFSTPLRRTVINYHTQEQCEMRSLDRTFRAKEQDLEVLAHVCNEPLIYGTLFNKRCNGLPYSIADAERFFFWARDGWARGEWFVFLIRNSQRQIVGVIDIKSSQLEDAEIGYYASSHHPGIMTNAVLQLCELAHLSGYQSLVALVAAENKRSIDVLTRARFRQEREQLRHDKKYLYFRRLL